MLRQISEALNVTPRRFFREEGAPSSEVVGFIVRGAMLLCIEKRYFLLQEDDGVQFRSTISTSLRKCRARPFRRDSLGSSARAGRSLNSGIRLNERTVPIDERGACLNQPLSSTRVPCRRILVTTPSKAPTDVTSQNGPTEVDDHACRRIPQFEAIGEHIRTGEKHLAGHAIGPDADGLVVGARHCHHAHDLEGEEDATQRHTDHDSSRKVAGRWSLVAGRNRDHDGRQHHKVETLGWRTRSRNEVQEKVPVETMIMMATRAATGTRATHGLSSTMRISRNSPATSVDSLPRPP